ncbi:MAG TPA: hypothetical protein VMT98_16275 [Verrucomicrobiae bacterium]|nr:hypothetical protein [Verrucomicrobiae bacterium]
MVFFDDRFEQLLAMRLQALEGAGLIPLHEPAIAGHVSSKDGGEMAFHGGACRIVKPDPGEY